MQSRVASKKLSGRKRVDVTQAHVRSAITNGRHILTDCDHRSTWMRRLRDLIKLHISDLGGDANVTEAERRLVRRAAMLTLQLEMMEQRWATNAEGEAKAWQLNDYQRSSNSLRRILESLGLRRRARNVTPTLEQYARRMEAAE